MRAVSCLLVATVSLLAACVDVSGESTTTNALVTANRLTANRLTANRLTANRLTANRLTANRLTANRLTANRLTVNLDSAGEMLSTEEGRELFSFIVSCALPSRITLQADVDGTTFEFLGEIGLAPAWLAAPLTREGQGWVSACLLARVSANDVALPISMRGLAPALAAGAGERAGWALEEGSFYGNLFTPLDQPIQWVACRGADQAAGEFGGLIDRDCAEPDPADPGFTQCGFVYAGDCGAFAAEQACEQFSAQDTSYRRCHLAPLGQGVLDGGGNPVFRQVITTYVIP